MKVAFVDQAGDETGGAQESLALLLGHLPQTVDPDIILFGDGRYAQRLREMGLRVHVLATPTAIAGATREGVSLQSGFAALGMLGGLITLLRRLQPSVVHTNTVKAHVVGGVAARIGNVPTVAHFRDVLEGRGRTLVRSAARVASRERIAISSLVARSFALPHTSVIENPLELGAYANLPGRSDARERLGLPRDKPIVVLVGRINRWKGHDRFLRAAAAIAPAAHFVIAGAPRFRDADFLPELHAMVQANGLRESVTFLDWLEDPRVLFAAADVNVNCSTREPFGRTVIEAAAAGVPTVCFDDAGVAEFMRDGDGGTVVRAGDEAGLTAAIATYVAMDATERGRTGRTAATWARRFAADRHAARVTEILERAAQR